MPLHWVKKTNYNFWKQNFVASAANLVTWVRSLKPQILQHLQIETVPQKCKYFHVQRYMLSSNSKLCKRVEHQWSFQCHSQWNACETSHGKLCLLIGREHITKDVYYPFHFPTKSPSWSFSNRKSDLVFCKNIVL